MNFRISLFILSFLLCNQIQSQEYNPFKDNKYATFKACTDTTSKNSEICFRKTLIEHLSKSFSFTKDKNENNEFERNIYFSFSVDSVNIINNVQFFDHQDKNLTNSIEKTIFSLPKMSAAIEDEIAGNTDFILLLRITPENNEIFEVIDIKTKFNNPKKINKENSADTPFQVISEAPAFDNCVSKIQSEQRSCFQQNMVSHISENFNYPEYAVKNNIQGKVYTIFIIDKKGNVSDIKTRGPHPNLELEARRIIAKIPKVKPATQRGRPVEVPFAIPITFKL